MNTLRSDNRLRQMVLLGFALLLMGTVGCGSDDSSPTAPANTPPEEEEILEPRLARITKLYVNGFDKTKGETNWDATLNIDNRRPDVYATMQTGASSPFYRSVTFDDAHGNYRYDLSRSAVGSHLPKAVSAGSQVTFTLFDEDDISADDFMGASSFRLSDRYQDDNARTFTWVVQGSGEVVFRVEGEWVY